MIFLVVFSAVGIVLFLIISAFMVSIFNRLVALKNVCDNGFAQIEIQLKRRYDLIPNLVECVKSYMKHERETLENVIAARNQAATGLSQLAGNLGSAQALKSFAGAEGLLTGALGRLNMVMEAYPDLKANENVAMLTEELTSTENKVAFARQAYNDWVMGFNTYRESFPTTVVAPLFGFSESRPLLEFEDTEDIQQAPVVSFS